MHLQVRGASRHVRALSRHAHAAVLMHLQVRGASRPIPPRNGAERSRSLNAPTGARRFPTDDIIAARRAFFVLMHLQVRGASRPLALETAS